MKTIFIAKTERFLCEILCSCCTSLGLNVIGKSTDGREALDFIENHQPDFAIIEADLPSINGFEIIKNLRKNNYPIQFILYLHNNNPDHLRKALSLKIDSMLFAEDSINDLANCFIESSGFNQFSAKRIENCLKEIKPIYKTDPLMTLTPSQLKILALVSTHRTMPEIARKLYISPHTVNNHIANIRKKLNLKGRGKLLKYALDIKHRLIEVDGRIIVNNYLTA